MSTDDLWMREMSSAGDLVEAMDTPARLRVMTEAVEFAAYRSRSQLSSRFSEQVDGLVRSALQMARSGAGPAPDGLDELRDEIDKIVNEEGAVSSIMLMAGMSLLFAVLEAPRASEVTGVLSACYDATMQAQGFGRKITLADQLSSSACLEVIEQQKQLLAAEA